MSSQDSLLCLKTAALLDRMSATPDDNALWVAFVNRLGPDVYAWCRRRSLQEADVENLTVKLMGKIWEEMKNGTYRRGQGSARGWIFTILKNLREDDRRWHSVHGRERGTGQALPEFAIKDVCDLDRLIDAEHNLWVMGQALGRVREVAEAKAWAIFSAAVLEDKAVSAVAARFGVTANSVSVIKCRMLKRIRAESERIKAGTGVPEGVC